MSARGQTLVSGSEVERVKMYSLEEPVLKRRFRVPVGRVQPCASCQPCAVLLNGNSARGVAFVAVVVDCSPVRIRPPRSIHEYR